MSRSPSTAVSLESLQIQKRACHGPLHLNGAFPAARPGLVRTCTRIEGPAEGAVGQRAEPRIPEPLGQDGRPEDPGYARENERKKM